MTKEYCLAYIPDAFISEATASFIDTTSISSFTLKNPEKI